MTDRRETLLGLAERCKQGAGPDRELDKDIALALGWEQRCSVNWGIGAPHWYSPDGRTGQEIIGWWAGHGHGTLPHFTASFDAAITLVPEGWTALDLMSRQRRTRWIAKLARLVGTGENEEEIETDRCATPALALTAACLRALAAQVPE